MANKSNSQYKSTLFSTIFSEKENALEMYNALNGTDYDNPEEITFITGGFYYGSNGSKLP